MCDEGDRCIGGDGVNQPQWIMMRWVNDYMNVLFLTLYDFSSLQERNIYPDLLREFVRNGHSVYIISPIERRKKVDTHIIHDDRATILKLQIGNTQKTNVVEKGISTILIEPQYKHAIKRFFSDVKFDLVLYSTPPITLLGAVEYVIKRDHAKSFLLLKDIFPQNAVDIGMMKTSGIKGVLYRYFRKKEKKLYTISDHIGCMSQANVDYLLTHNPEVDSLKVCVCPNSIDVVEPRIIDKKQVRAKYGLIVDKIIFVYGGNLGKPQDVPFIIRCMEAVQEDEQIFFLVIGNGTDSELVKQYQATAGEEHIRFFPWLPTEDYDALLSACDVGLIFLDHRFTIPNFPSRLLGYMQAQLPVLAVTDHNSDIGQVITDGGFGWWCESDDVEKFRSVVQRIIVTEKNELGDKAFEYLTRHYDIKLGYQTIMNRLSENENPRL